MAIVKTLRIVQLLIGLSGVIFGVAFCIGRLVIMEEEETQLVGCYHCGNQQRKNNIIPAFPHSGKDRGFSAYRVKGREHRAKRARQGAWSILNFQYSILSPVPWKSNSQRQNS